MIILFRIYVSNSIIQYNNITYQVHTVIALSLVINLWIVSTICQHLCEMGNT